jgi:hypothetical protein
MVIFSLGAVPITALLVSILLKRDQWFDHDLWGSFRRGILVFVPAAVLYFIIPTGVPPYLKPGALFLFYWLHDYLLFQGIAIIVFLLFFGFSGDGDEISVFLFFAGFYTLAGVVDTIDYFGSYNLYVLFLLPVLRIGLLFATTLLLKLMLDAFQFLKVPFLIGAPALSCIPGIIALLFYRNFTLLSIVITVLFFGGALASFLLLRDQ